MLACPQCQFENPSQNRFCQRCGSPLRPLWAVVLKGTQAKVAELGVPLSEETQLPEGDDSASLKTLADLLHDARFLDDQKRYQLRSPADADQTLDQDLEFAVIDTQPAAPPPLGDCLASLDQELSETPETLETPASLPADSEPSPCDRLPEAAQLYLKLQSRFFPAFPALQATVSRGSYVVLILEDRSHWYPLSEEWVAVTEPLELIHWLYEMTELWRALEPWNAQASLLNQGNLLVDDDQILGVRRLYQRSGEIPHTLKDLGLLWQVLLQQTADPNLATVVSVATAIATGEMSDLDTVQEQLAAIADALQDTATPMVSATAPPPDLEVLGATEGEENPHGLMESATIDLLPDGAMDNWDAEHPSSDDDSEDDAMDAMFNDDGDPLEVADMPTMALPMKLFRLDEVGLTHVGRQREHNEDFFYAQTTFEKMDGPEGPSLDAQGLYILCDGMGGHAGGEVASALAVATLRDYFKRHWHGDLPDEETIREGISKANQAIYEKNETDGRAGNARMGTTLVMVLLQDNQAMVAHVGDSRLYCLTRRGFYQVTVDHEVGQREIQRGVEPAIAYARPDAYQLTQALGPRDSKSIAPSVNPLYINEDTLLLLCSDGLSDNDLLENHIDTHVAPMLRSRHDLEEGVAQLIELANEHNGHDNITAIAVRLKVRPNLEALRLISG
jgi:protein phosphatase